jgi:hypothetical protein
MAISRTVNIQKEKKTFNLKNRKNLPVESSNFKSVDLFSSFLATAALPTLDDRRVDVAVDISTSTTFCDNSTVDEDILSSGPAEI